MKRILLTSFIVMLVLTACTVPEFELPEIPEVETPEIKEEPQKEETQEPSILSTLDGVTFIAEDEIYFDDGSILESFQVADEGTAIKVKSNSYTIKDDMVTIADTLFTVEAPDAETIILIDKSTNDRYTFRRKS